jgi:hypothetical protein
MQGKMKSSLFDQQKRKDDSFQMLNDDSIGNYEESRVPNSGYFDKNRLTAPVGSPSPATSQIGRSTSPAFNGASNPQRNNVNFE